jgi:hypothetical protein
VFSYSVQRGVYERSEHVRRRGTRERRAACGREAARDVARGLCVGRVRRSVRAGTQRGHAQVMGWMTRSTRW